MAQEGNERQIEIAVGADFTRNYQIQKGSPTVLLTVLPK